MKVIKRDGSIVDYDKNKIISAIEKANKEVSPEDRIVKKDIRKIINYIEKLNKKRMLVEDIQDIIELKLMEYQKFNLAKKYIVYRYNRALVRKQNTTDESILTIIKNKNKEVVEANPTKNSYIVSTQRDLIAGEVSKDLTKRILLPEKISKAHEMGIFHFHDAEYFLQPIFNSCLINIGDMLDNGTVMNSKMIEQPKSFQVACTIITQILASVASSQYGGQSIDIRHLGKYLRKSKIRIREELQKCTDKLDNKTIDTIVDERLKKELASGVQTIGYQINTLMTANGQSPFVTLFLYLDEIDEYIEENAMIIEEIIRQRYIGIKNEHGEYVTPNYPKLIYVLDENNCLKGGKYDYLTRLAVECSKTRKYPYYISAKRMREIYNGNIFSPMDIRQFLTPWKDESGKYKFEGRFNQGVVTLNLPQIGIIANGDEEKFWDLLNERLELCFDALMRKHYALLGTVSDVSPLHWRYGAISRLGSNEKVDILLKGGYSTLSLGYIGLSELIELMKNCSITSQLGKSFAMKVMKYLKKTVEKWKSETGCGFTLYATPSGSISTRLARIDQEQFGELNILKKGYYTNSYYTEEKMDYVDKLKYESEFQNISTGGFISYVDITEITDFDDLISNIYEISCYTGFKKVEGKRY